jgi:hypothetical protein
VDFSHGGGDVDYKQKHTQSLVNKLSGNSFT